MQICPGALLRAEAEKGSPLGKSIKILVEQAKLLMLLLYVKL